MLVESFSSGSSGNALLVRHESVALLVDCGIGPRVLRNHLRDRGLGFDRLAAVLVTHEHSDHVRGLDAPIAARCRVHATNGTLDALGLGGQHCTALEPLEAVAFDGLEVVAIPTSHDASQPCGYAITDGTSRLVVLTDLGRVDEEHRPWIAAADLLVIEANHDVHMLRSGPYPPHLKRRVQSHLGHLSNADCGAVLAAEIGGAKLARTVWLAHLSATNNRPDLAVRTVRESLGAASALHDIRALPRGVCGPVWDSAAPRKRLPDQLSLLGI